MTVTDETEAVGFDRGLSEAALFDVLAQPWLADLLPVPANAVLPRLQSPRHPEAVGSYGALAESEGRAKLGVELRWFQRYAVRRLLEHRADGSLCWAEAFVSAARQVGKSYLIQVFALFRVSHPEIFDTVWRLLSDDERAELEAVGRGPYPQLVMIGSQSLSHARTVQKPALDWAMLAAQERRGWDKTLRAEEVALIAPDGSRWRIVTLVSVTGATVHLMLVDEAWQADPQAIESRVEPALVEAINPQLVYFSTAGSEGEAKATATIPEWRAAVLADLEHERRRLILEWSAPSDTVGTGTEREWRMASPHWSEQRHQVVEKASEKRAPRKIAAFRGQWLNIWPTVQQTSAETLLSERAVRDATTTAPPRPAPGSHAVVAVEDFHGRGAALAMAFAQSDGTVWVGGDLFEGRTEAVQYAAAYVERVDPDARVLLGASMETDPMLLDFPVTPELRGTVETRRDVLTYRRMVSQHLVHHDADAVALHDQLAGAEVIITADGIRFSPMRHDLAQAAVWAVTEAARLAEPVG